MDSARLDVSTWAIPYPYNNNYAVAINYWHNHFFLVNLHLFTYANAYTHKINIAAASGGPGAGIFSQSNLQQQQQSQQTALVQAELTVNAVKSPGIFPDERDVILTKLNMVQASAGTGTGLVNYGGQHQTVNFTPDNVLCRFKVSNI